MPGTKIEIRPFERDDSGQLLGLMKQLARFEGYIQDFLVTEADLENLGLGSEPAFRAYVAVECETLVGYAVCYAIPFTYDLKPSWVLKEFFVAGPARRSGVGGKLFDHVKNCAVKADAVRLDWLVLPDNQRAMKFYRSHGGEADQSWQRWQINFAKSG